MSNLYNIELLKNVEKFIKKQSKDVKKLKGYENYYRLRVGDIRIIFEKEDDKLKIIVIDIGNRGQIYNKY